MKNLVSAACLVSQLLILFLIKASTALDLDMCYQRLGLEDGKLPDSALSASSSYDEASVGPQNARLHSDVSGGAWCPAKTVSRDTPAEYLEVDLSSMHVITATYTQGRFGNGRGQEYAEAYRIQYWRPGLSDFIDYHDSLGRKILPGNSNTYAVANNTLNPAIFASKIRLLPYSDHPRTVCMRIELVGCLFQEGVVAYSIPQGMVRGSMLELMDHTFDGHEDSLSGDLRGGLGQLVDGVYGWDNFKAAGINGHVKGYDWVGWKKKSNEETLDLVFTFDHVRTFNKVVIHINNHFTKDIQVFKKAKVYFSNEEDKFADDRVVDFSYMPDLAMENARNVSINLKEEHGQYVMLQLSFAAKWILISEITFFSEPRVETLFPVSDQNDYGESNSGLTNIDDISSKMNGYDNGPKKKLSSNPSLRTNGMDSDVGQRVERQKYQNDIDEDTIDIEISSPGKDGNNLGKKERTVEETDEYVDSRTVGVIIGVLLTIISLLVGGILYVIYRNKRCNGLKSTSTPTHSLLTRKFTDRFSTSIDFKDMHIYNGTNNSNNTHEYNGSGNMSGIGSMILPSKLQLKSSLTGSNCPPMYGHLVATSARRMLDGDRSGSNQEETIYEEPLNSINQRAGTNATRDDCIIGGTEMRPPAPPYNPCTGAGGINTTSGGFLSLNRQHRKFSSDPVLSEADYATDEYAEPGGNGNYGGSGGGIGGGNASNSYSENIYAQALPVVTSSATNNNIQQFTPQLDQKKKPFNSSAFGSSSRNLPPLPIAHYARPLSPPTMHSNNPPYYGGAASTTSPDQMSTTTATPIIASADTENNFHGLPPSGMNNTAVGAIMFPPPPGTNPGSMVVSGTTSTSASSSLGGGGIGANGTLTRSVRSPPTSGVRSSATPSTTKSRRKMSGAGTNGSRSSSRKNSLSDLQKMNKKHLEQNTTTFYASVDVSSTSQHQQQPPPHAIDLAKLYAQIHKNTEPVLLNKPFTRSISIDTVNVELNEIPRSNLKIFEKLGEGQFGEIHLCQLISSSASEEKRPKHDLRATLVAVKSLRIDCDETFRSDFEHEARILTSLNDPNLVRVLGVCFEGEPACMVCEYTEEGDLYQFLQDHVAETSLSKSPGVPTLSYGCLIYLATQIASGMKYLESLNFVHRDLATRNCLVGPRRTIKISDFGMSRSIYKSDYYKSQAGCLLPIRWMAWESVLLGKFTTKSDVWSFGVTMWEVLTFAREQPYESSSDEKVIANLSSLYSAGNAVMILPPPFQCPREVRDLMLECWQRDENERPSFREIHLFLQRKNLGYNPLMLSDDGGIQTDDVEESYGDETSATETDDEFNRRREVFEGESADGAEDEFSETDREYDQR